MSCTPRAETVDLDRLECRKCQHCTAGLFGRRFVVRDNFTFCCSCYELLFTQICSFCKLKIGIDDGQMSYHDFHWHATAKCFSCARCRKPLFGQPFIPRGERIFCSLVCSKLQDHRGNLTLPNPKRAPPKLHHNNLVSPNPFDSLRLPELKRNERIKTNRDPNNPMIEPNIEIKPDFNFNDYSISLLSKPSFILSSNNTTNGFNHFQKRNSLPIFETLATLNDPFLPKTFVGPSQNTTFKYEKNQKTDLISSSKTDMTIIEEANTSCIKTDKNESASEINEEVDKIKSTREVNLDANHSEISNKLTIEDVENDIDNEKPSSENGLIEFPTEIRKTPDKLIGKEEVTTPFCEVKPAQEFTSTPLNLDFLNSNDLLDFSFGIAADERQQETPFRKIDLSSLDFGTVQDQNLEKGKGIEIVKCDSRSQVEEKLTGDDLSPIASNMTSFRTQKPSSIPSRSLPNIPFEPKQKKDCSGKPPKSKPKSRLKKTLFQTNMASTSCKSVSFNPLISERPRSESFSNDDLSANQFAEKSAMYPQTIQPEDDMEEYVYFQNELGQFYKVSSMWLKRQTRVQHKCRGPISLNDYESSDSDSSTSSSSDEDDLPDFYSPYVRNTFNANSAFIRQKSWERSHKSRPLSCIPNYISSRHSKTVFQSKPEADFESNNRAEAKFKVFSFKRKCRRNCKIS